MKLPRRTSFLAAFSAILLFSGAAIAASHGTPDEKGMRRIADRVYADPEMGSDQEEKLLQLVDASRQRVAAFYGQAIAHPNIIFCASNDCYRRFGAIGLGYTDGTNVIISPQGQRVAIVAHELAHMELSARIGGFAKVLDCVPQWFDEGLAVMISQAEEFSDDAWKKATHDGANAPALASLEAMADWNRITGANGENMQLSYGTARREVRRWFGTAGLPGLHTLLFALSGNDTFNVAYSRIEGAHARRVVSAHATATPGVAVKTADWTNWQGNFARASW